MKIKYNTCYFTLQVEEHYGSNDGYDGEVREQLRRTSQRENKAFDWREAENWRLVTQDAAKVS